MTGNSVLLDSEKDFIHLRRRFERIFRFFAVFWTIVIAGIFLWEERESRAAGMAIATESLRNSFFKDIAYRNWATIHGGVYVPVTPETLPNPYLMDHPERDITTPSGKRLTLMNPAYMTRQVHELSRDLYGLEGHITSLRPIRPENRADPWETGALLSFEEGVEEKLSITPMNGRPHLRLMRPFRVDEGCLSCHARQGYRVGDIRGGISVSVPWDPVRKTLLAHAFFSAAGFGGIWLLGMAGILWARRAVQYSLEERRRAVQEREDMQQQVLHARKFESLGLVTSGVAHSFSNDLQAILGYTELLGMDIPRGTDTRLLLDRTVEVAKKAGKLIEQLLAYSGQRIFRFRPVDVNAVLGDMAREIGAAPSHGKVVRFRYQRDLPLISGDPAQLRRLTANLVANAEESLPERGGEIRVAVGEMICSADYLEGNRLNNRLQPGRYVFIDVIDSGAGMDEETRSRLFEPFFTTKDLGRGMGMSEVMGIVEGHGGGIFVTSRVGRGTTVRTLLPVVAPSASDSSPQG